MGPKETWLLKAPLDVNKVAYVALLSLRRQTTKKMTGNRQKSFLLIYVIGVHATLAMLFCKRMDIWWKKCFARAIKVLRTTGKHVSKTFQPNKIKRFQQNKRTFLSVFTENAKKKHFTVRETKFIFSRHIGKARLRHCRK